MSRRERICGRLCVEHVDSLPEVVIRQVKGVPSACFQGLAKCGHIWTCPVCSLGKRAHRAERIDAALRGLGGKWQMITLTVRHRQGMALRVLRRGLSAAWRRCKQGGAMQEFWSVSVSASVRACEITWGENGWHPHLHVLIRTLPWPQAMQDLLLERWQKAVRQYLGSECNPSDVHGLVWSATFDASDGASRGSYLSKLGSELAGFGKTGSLSHWQVAERAAVERRETGSLGGEWCRRWLEFQDAVRGARMIELDERASDAAKAQLQKDHEDDHEPEGATKTIHVPMLRDDVRALRSIEWKHRRIFAWTLEAAEREGASGVREWIEYARSQCRSSPTPMYGYSTQLSSSNVTSSIPP